MSSPEELEHGKYALTTRNACPEGPWIWRDVHLPKPVGSELGVGRCEVKLPMDKTIVPPACTELSGGAVMLFAHDVLTCLMRLSRSRSYHPCWL